jgi:hypothetical protein
MKLHTLKMNLSSGLKNRYCIGRGIRNCPVSLAGGSSVIDSKSVVEEEFKFTDWYID